MKALEKKMSNTMLFCAYVLVALFGAATLFWAFIGYRASVWGVTPIIISCVVILAALALFVRLIISWKKSPERVFLLVSIPALFGFAFFILPDHVPDEIWHIYRIFTIENPGSAMVVPRVLLQWELPTNYAELYSALSSNYSWTDTVLIDRDMSMYLTHLYLIPGIVVKICMLINVNPFSAIFIARLVNATLFVIGGYWIIRMMPLAKVCMCVYLLNPMLIQQEASCSADVITNIVTLLFITSLLKAHFKDNLTVRDLVILIVLFVVTALSKYAYALLVFLFLLLVPKIEKKKTRVGVYVGFAAVFVFGLVFVVGFLQSDSYRQTLDLVRNPSELIFVLAKTAYEVAPMWVGQFLGSSLAHLEVSAWAPCVWAYAIVLLGSLVFNLGEERNFDKRQKVFILLLVLFVSVSMTLAFRPWSVEVDGRSDVILGVQGRYFLPFFILPFLCFSNPRSSLVRDNCLLLYSSVIMLIYAVDVLTLIRFFA